VSVEQTNTGIFMLLSCNISLPGEWNESLSTEPAHIKVLALTLVAMPKQSAI
jgi:hypothetical protein